MPLEQIADIATNPTGSVWAMTALKGAVMFTAMTFHMTTDLDPIMFP